jgi:hypothetical protein
MLTKRTNILFDGELWDLLTSLARRERSSVGEVVRKAISKVYKEENNFERRKKAFETIRKFRVKQRGVLDYKALINDGRKY